MNEQWAPRILSKGDSKPWRPPLNLLHEGIRHGSLDTTWGAGEERGWETQKRNGKVQSLRGGSKQKKVGVQFEKRGGSSRDLPRSQLVRKLIFNGFYEPVMTSRVVDTLTALCDTSCSWPTQGPGWERSPSLMSVTGEQRMLGKESECWQSLAWCVILTRFYEPYAWTQKSCQPTPSISPLYPSLKWCSFIDVEYTSFCAAAPMVGQCWGLKLLESLRQSSYLSGAVLVPGCTLECPGSFSNPFAMSFPHWIEFTCQSTSKFVFPTSILPIFSLSQHLSQCLLCRPWVSCDLMSSIRLVLFRMTGTTF